jgi:SAM-dependent methyltransferase
MPYDDQYYRRHRDEYHEWEKRLATDFFTRYLVRSVVDFGCGVGSFLDAGFKMGLESVRGYEINLEKASPYIPAYLKPHITSEDVTKPLPAGSFDCSWSVEVGEHIEPSGTIQFIKNLVNSTTRLLLLTCAPPGQPGTNHINLRPKEEWIFRVSELGMCYLAEEVQNTVARWRGLGAPHYILRNLMIFQKESTTFESGSAHSVCC